MSKKSGNSIESDTWPSLGWSYLEKVGVSNNKAEAVTRLPGPTLCYEQGCTSCALDKDIEECPVMRTPAFVLQGMTTASYT